MMIAADMPDPCVYGEAVCILCLTRKDPDKQIAGALISHQNHLSHDHAHIHKKTDIAKKRFFS
jgi:hypothetical protein